MRRDPGGSGKHVRRPDPEHGHQDGVVRRAAWGGAGGREASRTITREHDDLTWPRIEQPVFSYPIALVDLALHALITSRGPRRQDLDDEVRDDAEKPSRCRRRRW